MLQNKVKTINKSLFTIIVLNPDIDTNSNTGCSEDYDKWLEQTIEQKSVQELFRLVQIQKIPLVSGILLRLN
ncbi:hypothetical protein VYA_08160 [Vibrio alfacsensis]|nr:hypothetical protein VA249_18820 [Vibrio alfacsensis]BCN23624.1 hypothetical protein VYA_08160 [Vibrio alfacsensis]